MSKSAQAYKDNAVKSVADKNRAAREKIGQDPEALEERISIVDRDKYDVSGYTDQQINMALQGGTWDKNDMCRLTGNCDTDTPNNNNNNNDSDNNGGSNTNSGGSGPYSGAVNTVTGNDSNVGGVSGGGDKNTVIYGDGNTVDNSYFSQSFGDDVRNFYAAGGRGSHGGGVPTGSSGLYATPVSDATMSGFYGTKDTGKTAAEFVGKYAGINETWQTRGDKNWKKNGNFDYTTDKYRAINPMAMQERIDRQPIIQRDRSTLAYNRLYGDLDKYLAPEWIMPDAPAMIKDDIDKIAEGYRDDIG